MGLFEWGNVFAPVLAQVSPFGVERDDELDFLLAMHVLDCRLACDRFIDGSEYFVVDELVDVVTSGEGVGIFLRLMLIDPKLELRGYPCVEAFAFAREDVGVASLGHPEILWFGWD